MAAVVETCAFLSGAALKVDVCGLGFFLSGIHPLGVIWWAMAGTVIELLLGLLLMVLVLASVWLLAVIVCGLFWSEWHPPGVLVWCFTTSTVILLVLSLLVLVLAGQLLPISCGLDVPGGWKLVSLLLAVFWSLWVWCHCSSHLSIIY